MKTKRKTQKKQKKKNVSQKTLINLNTRELIYLDILTQHKVID